MEKITFICVGKLKEAYWSEALREYEKRLARYCTFRVKEVADEKTPQGASAAEEAQIMAREGARILKALEENAYTVALERRGKAMGSEDFAAFIGRTYTEGYPHIQFVIGGSLGLSDEVLKRSDKELSFSAMTFPHQMMRVILAEQVYRSYRIRNGEPYHK